MSMRLTVLIFLLLNWAAQGWCRADTLVIGTDQNLWYPYSYAEKGEAKGIHIDIVARALKNLGHGAVFLPRPWKRCLQEARQGKFDAVVSASYNEKRAEFLHYPDDAGKAAKSKWRITQVENAVITLVGDAYEFSGDVHTLPAPVRAPLGYSIIGDLKKSGVEAVTAPDIRRSMLQLVESGRGTVITPPENARRLNSDPRFAGKFKIHRQPVTSKSYFMVFSKASRKIKMPRMHDIWREIARLREDGQYVDQLFDHYMEMGETK